jgi:hypothetical protein
MQSCEGEDYMTNIGKKLNQYGGQNKKRVDKLKEDEGTSLNKLGRMGMTAGWM